MEFLKKHYEKIVLCVVLAGLATAVVWMGTVLNEVQTELTQPVSETPAHPKALVPLDLAADMNALAAVTNPPPVVLSGDHNLFNPVTWKRKSNGNLLKILKTGPDALAITNITPLYTVIAYDHPSGNGAVYILSLQQHSGKRFTEFAKKNEKTKSGLYIIRGIKGAPEDPTDLQLEIPETQETVWVNTNTPYKRVDGYTVDMKYEPQSLTLLKKRVNDTIALDNEEYKIVEITNNLARVESNKTKVTTIYWNGNP
ncbi:MAG TPA: hypothetical protein VFC44_12645 [Candidatus Saccharimonadales bacterium]|nr:hypothetical protein [Candidatus Saccharimonadales bacterium]